MISVAILTLNEESNLSECLASIPWTDDVHVIDSGSNDATVRIARCSGAKVHSIPFSNYSEQRNKALTLPFNHQWLLMLDADERLTPELSSEIRKAIENSDPRCVLYNVRRKDIFLGRWIKRASGYPTWFPRLMRPSLVRFSREVNEQISADGTTGILRHHVLHYPFNKGVTWWIERHNRYSSMEARVLRNEQRSEELTFGEYFSSDATRRRKFLKHLFYRIPSARPFVVFAYLYFVRLGILDGKAGLLFCLLRMSYEAMIEAKMAELDSRAHH